MTSIVYEETKPLRIDVFLAQNFPYTRSFFHHIIERGGVCVGDKIVKKSYKLQKNDTITIDAIERFLDAGILEECAYVPIEIAHETAEYCVINKPKGVVSHPNSIWDVNTPSVVSFLYHHYKKQLPSMGLFMRAGLIHRLDKDTNGCMLVAKTELGLAHFKKLFHDKAAAATITEKEAIPLKKTYTALCHITEKGKIFLTGLDGQLPYYIQQTVHAKVPHYTPKMGITKIVNSCHPRACDDPCSESEMYMDSRFRGNDRSKISEFATLTVEILTGRTHQIRYHLSQCGLPIVGDYLYGIKEDDETIPMQLSATEIEFLEPDGHMRHIKITQ